METISLNDFFAGALPTIPLIFFLATIIIGFDVIWRVEKKLDVFMKLLTVGASCFAIRKLIEVLGADDALGWVATMQWLDLFGGLFMLLAFIEMFRIVRELNNEK